MPDVPVPVPAEAAAAVPDLYQNYDPTGAMGGLFAPALIRGWQPSEDAVTAWTQANRSMTPQGIEDSRLPPEWRDQSVTGASDQYGGGRIPLNMDYSGRGAVDPEALRVWSQGGKYDWDARRNMIARRLAANAAAQGAARPPNPYEGML